MIKALGFRVMIEPHSEETEIEIKRDSLANTGVIIDLGDECWEDREAHWADIGDTVMIGRYKGKVFEEDGKVMRMVKDEEILMVKDNSACGWKPVGDRLIVLPSIKQSGLIALLDSTLEAEGMSSSEAGVISVGSECWEGRAPWCKPGDTVMIGKQTGIQFKGDDGLNYRLINDLDVLGISC